MINFQGDQPQGPPVRGEHEPVGQRRAPAQQVQRPHRLRAPEQQPLQVKIIFSNNFSHTKSGGRIRVKEMFSQKISFFHPKTRNPSTP